MLLLLLSRAREFSRPTAAAALGAAALVAWQYFRGNSLRRRASPPVLRGLPFLGKTLEYVANPSMFFQRWLQAFGGTFTTNLLFADTVVLHPSEENLRMFKGLKNLGWPSHFQTVLGRNSIAMVNDPLHKKLRLVSGRAFTQDRLDLYISGFHELTRKHLRSWAAWSAPRDARDPIKLYTFELAQRIILGIDLPEAEMRHLMELFDTAVSGLACILPFDLPGLHFRRAMAARREVVAVYQKVIDEKREKPVAVPRTMLEHVMASGGQDGAMPSDVELQDFCFTMQFAGGDTTLSTMQTMLRDLSKHPDVKRELQDEVDAAWDGEATVTRALLQRLHKCRAFALESIRLTPPVQTLLRTLPSDTAIDGFDLRAGTQISFGMKSVTDWTYGSDAGELKLSRYLDEQGSFKDKTHEFGSCSGFGCGPRMCIGYKFAMDEMSIFLLNLLHGHDFEVTPGEHVFFPFNYCRVSLALSRRFAR